METLVLEMMKRREAEEKMVMKWIEVMDMESEGEELEKSGFREGGK